MILPENLIETMPDHLKQLFTRLPSANDEVVELFPDSKSCDSSSQARSPGKIFGDREHKEGQIYPGENGSAARFFYCAKASKRDRRNSKHPTVKPINLLRYLARLITPPGGTILDPFAGSGTTGEAAFLEGLNSILIEREDEYFADIEKRIVEVKGEAEKNSRNVLD